MLFGGTGGANDLGDTWEWDGEAWTQIQDSHRSLRSGSLSIDFAPNLGSFAPLPFTLEITANAGGVTQSTIVEIA